MQWQPLLTALGSATIVLAVFLPPMESMAQSHLIYSMDTDVELAGIVFDDRQLVLDDLVGSPSLFPRPILPSSSDIDAAHVDAAGEVLFSLDSNASLAGGLRVRSADVVRFNGSSFSLEFDAAAQGVPDGANVDAVSVDASNNLLLSFDVSVDLGGTLAADEDLVGFDGATFSIFFDGSAEGIPEELDLDGAETLDGRSQTDRLLLSFDVSGIVGLDESDHDILEYDPTITAFSVTFDGEAMYPALERAGIDAVAVPEPSRLLQLAAGLLLVMILRSRHR